MKMYRQKISRMVSLTLASLSVAVILFFGGCATDTAQQSPSRPSGSSGAATTPARPAGGGGVSTN